MTTAALGTPGTMRPARSLPAFCRTAWVSEAASELWVPRFSKIKEALEDLAAITAAKAGGGTFIARPASGDRLRRLVEGWNLTVTATQVPATDFATTYGVAGRVAMRLGPPSQPGAPQSAECVCGRPVDAPGHSAASDPIWRLAASTSGAEVFDDGCGISVNGSWSSNPLLAAIGLFPGPVWPCCFTCQRAEAQAEVLCMAAAENGRREELDWLRHVLSWPVSWTALHGIAEIKTPVFRMVRDTGPTERTFTVRRAGTEMPERAAMGLDFPFRNPTRTAPVKKVSAALSAYEATEPAND